MMKYSARNRVHAFDALNQQGAGLKTPGYWEAFLSFLHCLLRKSAFYVVCDNIYS